MKNRKYSNSILKSLEEETKLLNFHLNKAKLEHSLNLRTLKLLNFELKALVKNLPKYNFLPKISNGTSLLVGEGNLSFTISLIDKLQQLPNLITSTYENYCDLPDTAKLNSTFLKNIGIKTLHDIDATKLHKIFNQQFFNTIIFQFPHSGSREGINGVNSNYVLVKDFIISASQILKNNGSIIITTVDNDFYKNTFQFDKLTEELTISKSTKYKFDPKDYPGYKHTMTHQEGSGIKDYNNPNYA